MLLKYVLSITKNIQLKWQNHPIHRSQVSTSVAAWVLVSKNLISTANKFFRSASNTFYKAYFVYIREQEILPQTNLACKNPWKAM